MSGIVKFPFGQAELVNKPYDATVTIDVLNMETIVTIGTLTGGLTLNLAVNQQVDAGANLTVKVTADETNRAVTFGVGITAVAHTTTASKSYAYSFKV